MADSTTPPLSATAELDPVQAEAVTGAEAVCLPPMVTDMTQTYQTLVDATSYVIERMINATKSF